MASTGMAGMKWPVLADELGMNIDIWQACGTRGADVRPDFNWEKQPRLKETAPVRGASGPQFGEFASSSGVALGEVSPVAVDGRLPARFVPIKPACTRSGHDNVDVAEAV